MTDVRFYTDESQRICRIQGSMGYGRREALRRFVKYAGTIDTDGRWRPKRPRFANIRAALTAMLERGK